MNHQKLKYEEKLTTVLSINDIKKMKQMRKAGAFFQEIADKFKVCHNTAWSHTASPQKVKEAKLRRRERTRIYNHDRYTNESEFRKNTLISNNRYRKFRRKVLVIK